jgi:hypothetical protein
VEVFQKSLYGVHEVPPSPHPLCASMFTTDYLQQIQFVFGVLCNN